MNVKRSAGVFLGVVGAAGAIALLGGSGTGTRSASATGLQLSMLQSRLLSGFASVEFGQSAGPSVLSAKANTGNFTPSANDGCGSQTGKNVKVNQNCLNISDASLQGRGQAQNETAIAADPNSPDQLIAGYNDYRRGDGTCGVSWSKGGNSWEDATLPNGFVSGSAFGAARQYFQTSGDPSVAWDSKGNAYYNCMMFQRGAGTTNNPDVSSGIYLYRSTGNSGASWNFTGHPVVEQFSTDPSGLPLLDKPYMTVDSHAGSPFQDRIYVTWTRFDLDGSAIIYEAYSNDYGQTFSSPVVVSRSSAYCTNSFGVPTTVTTCNENQFSDPFTGSDGALYVVFDNYNNTVTGSDNRNQVLLAKSTDGGQSFSAPVKVADFYDLPDCATYQGGQDSGRACVPEKGSSQNSVFRATNYPAAAVNPSNPDQVVVTFGSYINKDSKESNGCTPNGFNPTTGNNLFTGAKTAGACNNKILVSVSSDGGVTFTGTATDPRSLPVVNQEPGQATSDQFWQWAAFNKDGSRFAVSYYDRQYGNDETTGASDISLSDSKDMAAFKTTRVTSSSMPVPTEFPDSQGNGTFMGDYSGLAVGNGALPLWTDTRNPDLFLCPGTPGSPPQNCMATEPNGNQANDQDVYTAKKGLP